MTGLRDVCEVLGPSINTASVNANVWRSTQLFEGGSLSVRRLIDRFGEAGAHLAGFRTGSGTGAWAAGDRTRLAAGIRARLLDPAIMNQVDTALCGPISIAFLFAMRNPAGYARAQIELFETGKITCVTGRRIEPDDDLLGGDMPSPGTIDPADWMLGAALRDDENWFWDVEGDQVKDTISGGLTSSYEMASWSRDLIGLTPRVRPPLWPGGLAILNEMDMLRDAAKAVAAGKIAFLCINDTLIKDGSGDDEEQIGWVRTFHRPGSRGPDSAWTHSKDDGLWPTHWVVLLGDVVENGDDLTLRVWSYSSEYVLSGTADSFSEYLWGVVIAE